MNKRHFESKQQRHEVAKYLSLILREIVPNTSVQIDIYGNVSENDIISLLGEKYPFVGIEHIHEIVEKDPQQRFTLNNGKIRAKAGHKFPISLPDSPVSPPKKLYHGTSQEAVSSILTEGLLKMGKAYVHLASTLARARRVGLRKCSNPVILEILADKASSAGVKFWRSGQISPDGEIYLSEEIPPQFIVVSNDN